MLSTKIRNRIGFGLIGGLYWIVSLYFFGLDSLGVTVLPILWGGLVTAWLFQILTDDTTPVEDIPTRTVLAVITGGVMFGLFFGVLASFDPDYKQSTVVWSWYFFAFLSSLIAAIPAYAWGRWRAKSDTPMGAPLTRFSFPFSATQVTRWVTISVIILAIVTTGIATVQLSDPIKPTTAAPVAYSGPSAPPMEQLRQAQLRTFASSRIARYGSITVSNGSHQITDTVGIRVYDRQADMLVQTIGTPPEFGVLISPNGAWYVDVDPSDPGKSITLRQGETPNRPLLTAGPVPPIMILNRQHRSGLAYHSSSTPNVSLSATIVDESKQTITIRYKPTNQTVSIDERNTFVIDKTTGRLKAVMEPQNNASSNNASFGIFYSYESIDLSAVSTPPQSFRYILFDAVRGPLTGQTPMLHSPREWVKAWEMSLKG